MDPDARRILETFDHLALTRLRASDFSAASGPGTVSRLAQLVSAGFLREVARHYERTELGRLQVAAPLDWTILSRPGCHLCEQALRSVEALAKPAGSTLRVVNVDSDRVLSATYGDDVPVIFLGSREVARHHADPDALRAELSRAASAPPPG